MQCGGFNLAWLTYTLSHSVLVLLVLLDEFLAKLWHLKHLQKQHCDGAEMINSRVNELKWQKGEMAFTGSWLCQVVCASYILWAGRGCVRCTVHMLCAVRGTRAPHHVHYRDRHSGWAHQLWRCWSLPGHQTTLNCPLALLQLKTVLKSLPSCFARPKTAAKFSLLATWSVCLQQQLSSVCRFSGRSQRSERWMWCRTANCCWSWSTSWRWVAASCVAASFSWVSVSMSLFSPST